MIEKEIDCIYCNEEKSMKLIEENETEDYNIGKYMCTKCDKIVELCFVKDIYE